MASCTCTHTIFIIITVEVLNVLEESGLFKPEALAQLKNEAQGIVTDSTS